MSIPTVAKRCFVLILLCIPLASLTLAQTKPAGTSPDRAVTMSPFNVSNSKDVGYVAQNTLQGTRINSSLADIAAPLTVFTKEFMNDIGANSISDVAAYMPNMERENTENSQFQDGNRLATNDISIRIRGLSTRAGEGVTRDNFIWSLDGDSFNIDRIDFSRGPNSILFGIGSAAGTIDQTSKRAIFKPLTEVQTKFGNHEQYRAALDLNRPLFGDKLAVRGNLLFDTKGSFREHEIRESRRGAAAVTYRPFSSTELRFGWEGGKVDQVRYRPWGATDFVSKWILAGRPLTSGAAVAGTRRQPNFTENLSLISNTGQVFSQANQWISAYPEGVELDGLANPLLMNNRFSPNGFSLFPFGESLRGPGATSDFDYDNYTVTLEQKVGSSLFLQVAYNMNSLDRLTHSNGLTNYAASLFGDPNQLLPNGQANPFAGRLFTLTDGLKDTTNGDSQNFRATAAYKLNLERIKVGTFDFAVLYEKGRSASHGVQDRLFVDRIPAGLSPTLFPEDNTLRVTMRTYLDFEKGPSNAPDIRSAVPASITNAVTGESFGTRWLPFQGSHARTTTESKVAAAQGHLLWNRLVVTGGVRRDEQSSWGSDLGRNATTRIREIVPRTAPQIQAGSTYSVGAVGHLAKWVSAYYNKSSNFIPSGTRTGFANQPVDGIRGVGDDYGLKTSLLDNQLYLTAGRYKTSNQGQLLNAVGVNQIREIWRTLSVRGDITAAQFQSFDTTTAPFPADTYDNVSTGYEVTLQANLLSNRLNLLFNYARNDAKSANLLPNTKAYINANRATWTAAGSRVLTPGGVPLQPGEVYQNVRTVGELLGLIENQILADAIADEGTTSRGLTRHKMNLWANYSFAKTGTLRGWSVGGGARYRGRTLIQYSTTKPATRQPIYGNDSTLFDAKVGYGFRTRFQNMNVRVQLNVRNVFNDTDVVLTRALRDSTPISYVYQDPRDLSLTANFQF